MVTQNLCMALFMWLMQERCSMRVTDGPYNCRDCMTVPKDVEYLWMADEEEMRLFTDVYIASC